MNAILHGLLDFRSSASSHARCAKPTAPALVSSAKNWTGPRVKV